MNNNRDKQFNWFLKNLCSTAELVFIQMISLLHEIVQFYNITNIFLIITFNPLYDRFIKRIINLQLKFNIVSLSFEDITLQYQNLSIPKIEREKRKSDVFIYQKLTHPFIRSKLIHYTLKSKVLILKLIYNQNKSQVSICPETITRTQLYYINENDELPRSEGKFDWLKFV